MAPVGSYRENPWGLYDMLGNAWEWTEDCSNESYRGAPDDGSPWTKGDCSKRVVRGGSWDGEPRIVRSANGNRNDTDNRNNNTGLRVASTHRARAVAFTDAAGAQGCVQGRP